MKFWIINSFVIFLSMLCGACVARGVDSGDVSLIVASFSYVFPITLLSYLAELVAKEQKKIGPFKEDFQ